MQNNSKNTITNERIPCRSSIALAVSRGKAAKQASTRNLSEEKMTKKSHPLRM